MVEYLHLEGACRIAVVNADNSYAQDLATGLVQWIQEFGLSLGVQAGKTVPVVGYRHGLRDVLRPPELAT